MINSAKIFIKTILLVFIFSFLLTACCNPESAKKTLSALGFNNITILGIQWLRVCPKGDIYMTRFKATGLDGSQVFGTVCEGLIIKNAKVYIS